MTRRVLITGGSGFVGQWLSRAALERGWKVWAGTITGPADTRVLSDTERNAICWTPLDVLSEDGIRAAVELAAPDWVVHLAGIAFAPDANAAPAKAFDINALGVLRLVTALGADAHRAARLLVIGSAEQYGAQDPSAYPVPETTPLRPLTPYAVAKATQELIALQAYRATGLPVICTRSFNHSGVGHGDSYLLPTLVRRAGELPKSGGMLRIGNGTVRRDYLHVADVVSAYILLLERGQPGEVYNVCSGAALSVLELAERVLTRMGKQASVASDSTLLRPIDVPILLGDNTKLRTTTGWAPARSVDDIIDDLIHAA